MPYANVHLHPRQDRHRMPADCTLPDCRRIIHQSIWLLSGCQAVRPQRLPFADEQQRGPIGHVARCMTTANRKRHFANFPTLMTSSHIFKRHYASHRLAVQHTLTKENQGNERLLHATLSQKCDCLKKLTITNYRFYPFFSRRSKVPESFLGCLQSAAHS